MWDEWFKHWPIAKETGGSDEHIYGWKSVITYINFAFSDPLPVRVNCLHGWSGCKTILHTLERYIEQTHLHISEMLKAGKAG